MRSFIVVEKVSSLQVEWVDFPDYHEDFEMFSPEKAGKLFLLKIFRELKIDTNKRK